MRQLYKTLVAILCVFCCASLSAQVRTITFTGRDNTNQYHIPLHHVKVFNLDQLWEEVLYYPDTTLILGTVGIEDQDLLDMQLMQNVPNPFDGTTEFALVLPEDRNVLLEIYDISGRLAVSRRFSELPAGTHLFQATLTSPQTYLLSAKVADGQMTIKMVNEGHGTGNNIRHLGMTNANGDFTLYLKDDKSHSGFPFTVGDEMKYTGYAMIDGAEHTSQTVKQHQYNNEEFTLQFDVTAPTVITSITSSSLTFNSISCSAYVTDNGGSSVKSIGLCWGSSPYPTISENHLQDNSGVTSFTRTITGLSPNTTYHVRAFATNDVGTAYGDDIPFTTSCNTVNVNITGNININYGESTTLTATGANTYHWSNGVNTQSITVNPTTTTTYYVTGTDSYGCTGTANVTVTVNNPPTVTTNSVTTFTATTATCGGNVTSNGTTIIERGVCWSSSTTNPTLSDSHKAYGSGSGSFSFDISGLAANTTYYVKAYATYSGGTVYGDTKSFTTLPFTCGNTTTDYDGNSYNTVQIGQQCWMKENLRTTKYADGTAIPNGGSESDTSPYYYSYSSSNISLSERGYLYNWPAVMHGAYSSTTNPSNVQGVCPNGWHVPSNAEWTQLTNYVSSQSEYVCGGITSYIGKALANSVGWGSYSGTCCVGDNQSTNNATGFSAVPAGCCYGSSFDGACDLARFWSSSQDASIPYGGACGRSMIYYNAGVSEIHIGNSCGQSVRCLCDDSTSLVSAPTITTNSVTTFTATTATCGGNVISNSGVMITERGVCWSSSTTDPTLSDSHKAYGSGSGPFSFDISGLAANTTYHVKAYATYSGGTVYGTTKSFTTSYFTCGNTTTDYDGNSYNTVQIGQQCWMRENLRTTQYADGTNISFGGGSSSLTSAYYYYPNNNSSSVSTYGLLYNWSALMDGNSSSNTNPSNVQGVCPNGWHVPSDAEWTQLTDYVSSQSQYWCNGVNSNIAKALSATSGWDSSSQTCAVGNDQSENNTTGFSAVPAGNFDINGNYNSSGNFASFWSASEDYLNAWERRLLVYLAHVDRGTASKGYGFSVRCLCDDSTSLVSAPTITTNAVTTFTATTATCGGNVTNNGTTIIERGVCWSSSTTDPTLSDSYKAYGSGSGPFSFNISGLADSTTYYVKAYATYNGGTVYGATKSFTTSSFSCGSFATDYDGNSYNTVQIGQQCWMKENLKTTHLNNGVSIPLVQDSTSWESTFSAAYCYYDISSYGCLYNFYAVDGNQLCPPGWHVPAYDEVHSILYDALGEDGGGGMKTTGMTYWLSPNTGATNSSGFSARGGGFRLQWHSISGIKEHAVFWTSTIYDSIYAYDYHLQYNHSSLSRWGYASDDYAFTKGHGLSVRCLRGDIPPVTFPTVGTNGVDDISADSATCGGYISAIGNAPITAKGVCWSTLPNPTINDSFTNEGGGCGFGSFTSSITGLSANTTYYVKAYATNEAGTAYGAQKTFTTGIPFTCGSVIYDVENHPYNTVQIGQQCWMKQNLRSTHYADGTSIQYGGSNTSATTAYYYYPNNSSSTVSSYGLLYNWAAIMHGENSSSNIPSGVQGICPNGWHIPSDAEWSLLIDFVTSQDQYLCSYNTNYIAKALASSTGWINNNESSCGVGNNQSLNNATGFDAMPAGTYFSNTSNNFGYDARFWTSTKNSNTVAYSWLLYAYSPDIQHVTTNGSAEGYSASSIRCLRDESSAATPPEVTTSNVNHITATTASCGGNVISNGAAVTARGLCWSTSPNPTVNNNHKTMGQGDGSFTGSITGLTPGTTYYVCAFATNSAGTTYGDQKTFTTSATLFTCGSTIVDYDNNTYTTVQIGQQCWMKQNLRTTHYADGTSIMQGGTYYSNAFWEYPNGYPSNKLTYGLLYSMSAVLRNASYTDANPSGVQGICPDGWHVPSNSEWTQLKNYLSSQSQYVCGTNNTYIAKALASTSGWTSNTTGSCVVGYNQGTTNNASGFNAFPAGDCRNGFYRFGIQASFWSTTLSSFGGPYYQAICSDGSVVYTTGTDGYGGYSVRCIKN